MIASVLRFFGVELSFSAALVLVLVLFILCAALALACVILVLAGADIAERSGRRGAALSLRWLVYLPAGLAFGFFLRPAYGAGWPAVLLVVGIAACLVWIVGGGRQRALRIYDKRQAARA